MLKSLNVSVFDGFLLAFLVLGILRGRKRGISEEFLDVIQWLLVVVGAGFGYPALGHMLIQYAYFPPFFGNVMAYIIIGALIVLLFRMVKRGLGEKLVQGDVFGRYEFYLGMLAGFIRFACIALFFLAMIHAKYSTQADRDRFAELQRRNFGSISFPTLDEMQYSIFYKSASGNLIRTNLSLLLIKPVPNSTDQASNTIGRRREAEVDRIFSK